MSSKVEYLEKYSVAPPPSRDYYGIKVLRDEVILFLWKISHGPHRTPTIKVSKFSEFGDDKILQGEIQRVFGNYLLHHVKNIVENKENSILTLPKSVIARISKYLKLKDIINLTTLSRTSKEVFDNESVWETLYRKYKKSKVSKEEKKYAMASSWKQLLKEKKLQESLKNHKSHEDKPKISQPIVKRSTSINLTTNHRNQNSSNLLKKLAEDSKKLPSAEPLRLNTLSKIPSEKQKLNLKSTTSMTKIADTKKLFPANKVKTDSKEKESSRSQLTINKSISQKINSLTKPKSSISLKSVEDLKARKNHIPNSFETKKLDQTLRNQKQIPAKLKIASKTQNKEVKSKKTDESRSTIFDSDKTLSKDLHVDDLSSLIEESLKNFKSPRSIFNCDFSILDVKKSAGDSKSISPKSEIQFLKKESCPLEDFTNSSARSEISSDDDEKLDMTHFTQKYLKARAEFMKKMSEVSNLSTSKTPGSNNSSANVKLSKSLNPIPENLKKARASIFAAKKMEDKNLSQEKFKLHSTKGISNFKK